MSVSDFSRLMRSARAIDQQRAIQTNPRRNAFSPKTVLEITPKRTSSTSRSAATSPNQAMRKKRAERNPFHQATKPAAKTITKETNAQGIINQART